MIGVLVNTVAVIIGSIIGLCARKGIPEKYRNAIMLAIGICTCYIGFSGALAGENVLAIILAMVLGVAAGTALDLDGKINRLADRAAARFSREGENGSFAQGLVTAFLLWCVGAMTIVGSLEAGFSGNCEMLYTKSLLDFISAMMLASSLGIGVLMAAVPLFLFQGGLVLLSGLILPLLTDTMVNEITCVGSLLIFALSLNLMGLAKIKVADFLPAIVLVPFTSLLFGLFM